MYERNTRGWVKHLDFIFWDIVSITVAFLLAYGLRFGVWTVLDDGIYRSYYLV